MLSDEDEERLNEKLSEMGAKLDLAESKKLELVKLLAEMRKLRIDEREGLEVQHGNERRILTSEIDRLRKQSELLHEEIRSLQITGEKRAHEFAQLSAECHGLQSMHAKEIGRFRQEMEHCRERLAKAGQREQKQEEEIKDLERRLSKSSKEEGRLRKELELQVKAGAEEMNSLRQELAQHAKEVDRLGKAAESWERTARQNYDVIHDLSKANDRIASLTAEKDELAAQRNDIITQRDDFEARLRQSRHINSQHLKDKEVVAQENAELIKENGELKTAISSIKNQVSDLVTERNRLHKEAEALQKQVKLWQDNAAYESGQTKQAYKASDLLKSELTKEKELHRQTITRWTDYERTLKGKHALAMKEVQSQLSGLKHCSSAEELERLRNQIRDQKKSVNHLQKLLDAERAAVASRDAQIAGSVPLKHIFGDWREAARDKASEAVEAVQPDFNNLMKENEFLIDTSEKLREKLGAEMQKTSQLENECSRLMRENAALTITNNGLSTENAELRSSLEGGKTQIQELQSRLWKSEEDAEEIRKLRYDRNKGQSDLRSATAEIRRLELEARDIRNAKEDLQKQTIRAESFLEALKALGVA
jgi:chromosome segregation ATPase